MVMRFAEYDGMALLQDFVYRDKRFEGLHLVCQDRLSIKQKLAYPYCGEIKGGKMRTLSYQPKRRQTTCGPRYTR